MTALFRPSRFSRSAVALWSLSILFSSAAAAFPGRAISVGENLSGSFVLDVRDICRVYTQGNQRVTQYCDHPYVCDLAANKCKPGPELQRQIDEERRQREAELRRLREQQARLQAEYEARVREVQRQHRAGMQARSGTVDNRVASGCATIRYFDQVSCVNVTGLRANTQVSDPRSIPGYQPVRAPGVQPQQRAQPQQAMRPSPSLRNTLRFQNLVGPMVEAMRTLPRSDPGRQEAERVLEAATRAYNDVGADTRAVLERLNRNYPERQQPNENSSGPQVLILNPVRQDAAERSAPPEPEAPPRPRVSQRDEALCSFLLSQEQGSAERLGVQAPDYCNAYARSIGHVRPDTDPRWLPWALEDKTEVNRFVQEAVDYGLLPPGGSDE